MALDQLPSTPKLAQSTPTSIARLSPSLEAASSKRVEAVVTLLWPYSSSAKTFVLLLADPDFRLRRAKGQVKVAFFGPSAKAVARTTVGIGDHVKLSLDGASWTHLEEDIHTPGKNVDWDISFKNRVELEVFRDGITLQTVNINEQTPPPSPRPGYLRSNSSAQINGYNGTNRLLSDAYYSPSFRRSLPAAHGSFLDATLVPLAEEDGFVWGQGRKRTKFGRKSSEWRFAERSPSPTKEDIVDEDMDGVEANAMEPPRAAQLEPDQPADHAAPVSPVLVNQPLEIPPTNEQPQFVVPPLPPPREGLPMVSPRIVIGDQSNEYSMATTPRLQPLASPGLPLVSPLVKGDSGGGDYFALFGQRSSDLDFSGQLREAPPFGSLQQPPALPTETIPLGAPVLEPAQEQVPIPVQQELVTSSPEVVDEDIQEAISVISSVSDVASDTSDMVHKEREEVPSDGAVEIASVDQDVEGDHDLEIGGRVDQHNLHQELDMYGVTELDKPEVEKHNQEICADELKEVEDAATTLQHLAPVFQAERAPTEIANPPSDQPRRWSQDYENKIAVSAVECVEDDMSIKPPPFPFRQGWDEAAISESKNRKRRRSRQFVYDGSVEEDEQEASDIEEEVDSASASGQSSILEATAKPIESESESEDEDEDEEPEMISPQSPVVSESESDDLVIISETKISPTQRDTTQLSESTESSSDAEAAEEEEDEAEQIDSSSGEEESDAESIGLVVIPVVQDLASEVQDESDSEQSDVEMIETVDEAEADQDEEDEVDEVDDAMDAEPEIADSTSEPEKTTEKQITSELTDMVEIKPVAEEIGTIVEQAVSGSPTIDKPEVTTTAPRLGLESELQDMEPKAHGLEVSRDTPASPKVIPETVDTDVQILTAPKPAFDSVVTTLDQEAQQAPSESGLPQVLAETNQAEEITLETAQSGIAEPVSVPVETDITPAQTKQLVTPNNTQEDQELTGTEAANIPPPGLLTPLATQLPVEVPKLIVPSPTFDGTKDTERTPIERRRSPRFADAARRTGPENESVSPWFTPRKTQPETESKKEAKDTTAVNKDLETQDMPVVTKEPEPKDASADTKEPEPNDTSADTKEPETQAIPVVTKEPETNDTPVVTKESKTKEIPAIPKEPEVIEDTIKVVPKIKSQLTTPIALDWPKGLHTSFSYFPSLSGLKSHFNQVVDVFGVCSSASTAIKRAPSGPKDYYTTLHIIDPTVISSDLDDGISQATSVQIFRPWRNALPVAKEGDVVLLRQFKVQTRKHDMTLLSTEDSGWVVFPVQGSEENISGPPVEFGDQERQHVSKLQTWWQGIQDLNKSKPETDNPEKEDVVLEEPSLPTTPVTRRHRRTESITSRRSNDTPARSDDIPVVHELRGGVRYTNSPTKANGISKEAPSVHELRDGTKYADREAKPRRQSVSQKQTSPEVDVVHGLRDGSTYSDRPVRTRHSSRSQQTSPVAEEHELRDGVTYRDG